MRRIARVTALWVLGLLPACSTTAEPRAQLVIAVDTNAPLPGHLDESAPPSAQLAVDTLVVEVLDPAGRPARRLDVVAPEPADWPVSFGIVAEGADVTVDVRLRLFAGANVDLNVDEEGRTIEPIPELTIDRLVRLDARPEGREQVRILLDAGCIGQRVGFVEPPSTCIHDGEVGAPTAGILPDDGAPTAAGTFTRAHEVPCVAEGPPGAACIPGGISVLGDRTAVGFTPSVLVDPVPLRVVEVSPFWMDVNEVTVSAFRRALAAGVALGEPPLVRSPGASFERFCTFLGVDDASNDRLPLSCVAWSTAAAYCDHVGGRLPTEAEWEHAARGRGAGLRYPWGDASPSCCLTSASRDSDSPAPTECAGQGVEPVGSHRPSEACDGLGDESRDGILDLGGSVSEMLLDASRPYDHPCWGPEGIVRDPRCEDATTNVHSGRGGAWNEGLGLANAALRRRVTLPSPVFGFRCVYEDEP